LEKTEVPSADQRSSKLTEREKQVFSSVFEGLMNKQIADRLRISETAVKASLQQLFAKTGVRTRSQLVRVALEQYRDQL
jgi:two-component system, NarL family, nitrate/nitrite response regulator NarL